MRQWSIITVGVLLMCVLQAVPAMRGRTPERFPGDVRLIVNGGALTDSMTVVMRRALRDIPGVFVTEGESDWTLQIVAVALTTRSGGDAGVAVSYAILKPHLGDPPGLVRWMDQGIRAGARRELGAICTSIIADFRTRFLEPERKKQN